MITNTKKPYASTTLYKALLIKDSSLYHKVYAAITSTNSVCNITCSCRKPNQENVVFFDTLLDALCYGYRECKKCKPLVSLDKTGTFKNYLSWLQNQLFPSKKYTDHPIANENELDTIKKWFKETLNTTLASYIRVKRVNHFLKEATHAKTKSNIFYVYKHHTPLGLMISCFKDKKLYLFEFIDRKMLETELVKLSKDYNSSFRFQTTKEALYLDEQILQYFKGERENFDVPVYYNGTDFQKNVWDSLCKIPYGKTISYQQQAAYLKCPNAVRAVAQSNGRNKISILIPCHRVIGSNGKLVGYGGGLHRKQALLTIENKK